MFQKLSRKMYISCWSEFAKPRRRRFIGTSVTPQGAPPNETPKKNSSPSFLHALQASLGEDREQYPGATEESKSSGSDSSRRAEYKDPFREAPAHPSCSSTASTQAETVSLGTRLHIANAPQFLRSAAAGFGCAPVGQNESVRIGSNRVARPSAALRFRRAAPRIRLGSVRVE